MRFREVDLQGVARGRLFLHSMLGRRETLAEAWQSVEDLGVQRIVCLGSAREIEEESPE